MKFLVIFLAALVIAWCFLFCTSPFINAYHVEFNVTSIENLDDGYDAVTGRYYIPWYSSPWMVFQSSDIINNEQTFYQSRRTKLWFRNDNVEIVETPLNRGKSAFENK